MFDPGTVLIVIALATAITGIYWDAKRWGKHAIVALAVVSASAAIWDSQNKAKEVESTRRNISWIVRAVQPPKIFDEAVLSGFRTVAEEYGLFVSGQTIDVEDGSRIFEFKESDDGEVSGVVYLGVADREELFFSFVTGGEDRDQGLVESIRNESIRELTEGKWGEDDVDNDWNIFVIHVYEIAKHAIGGPPDTTYEATIDSEKKEMIIDVYLPDGRYADTFSYDESFMVSLQEVPPIERGLMIYEKTLEQMTE